MTLKCFVIMPYAVEFEPVYAAVQKSAQAAIPGDQIVCNHLKDVKAAGRITDDIVGSLREAAFCIADVTGNNPNVMWETGFAMALGKPTILAGQDVDKLPFDLKIHRVLPYSAQDLGLFQLELVESIQQTLAKYDLKTSSFQSEPIKSGAITIAVTGSRDGDLARTRRRISSSLEPYLDRGVTWLCGTVGTVDETALAFLLEKKEKVIAVGYNRFDISDAARKMVNESHVPFIDATVESIPKGLTGPNRREIFLCLKADLAVVFWDGESKGTERVIRYFEAQEKNLMVAFI